MKFRRMIPSSLVGQTVGVLLAAVVLVHLGSMVAYRDSAFDAASAAHADQLAERLAAVSRSVAQLPAANRDEAAHDLSSVGLSLRWSDQTEMGALAIRDADLVRLRDRLAALLPGRRGDQIRLGYADRQPPGDAHAMLGSIGLPDGSFLSFRVPVMGDEQPGLNAAVLSTSLMAGGVALVAILLMRSIGRPLRGLARAADAIGRGPTIAVDERGPEEVRHVAVAFNGMQTRIDRLVADRTQALAAVSHDLRTPITRLRLRAGFMADPDLQSAVDADLDEMEAMIDATLAYLRGDAEPEEPRQTDLASMLSTLVDDAFDAGRPASFEGPRHAFAVVRPLAVKRTFANLIDKKYPGDDYGDLMASVDGVIARGIADSANLFVTGGSGGGVLTSWIVGKTDRFKAAAAQKPVINWISEALTMDASGFTSRYWFRKQPWEDPMEYWNRSPLSLVGNVKTPTLVIVGSQDYRTPVSESEQYYTALQIRGVPTALVKVPGASHGGLTARPSQSAAKAAAILAWFEKYRTRVTP